MVPVARHGDYRREFRARSWTVFQFNSAQNQQVRTFTAAKVEHDCRDDAGMFSRSRALAAKQETVPDEGQCATSDDDEAPLAQHGVEEMLGELSGDEAAMASLERDQGTMAKRCAPQSAPPSKRSRREEPSDKSPMEDEMEDEFVALPTEAQFEPNLVLAKNATGALFGKLASPESLPLSLKGRNDPRFVVMFKGAAIQNGAADCEEGGIKFDFKVGAQDLVGYIDSKLFEAPSALDVPVKTLHDLYTELQVETPLTSFSLCFWKKPPV